MPTTVDVRREARAAGIRDDADLSLASVEARRRQLWTVMSLVLLLVSLAAGATALFPQLAAHMVVSQRFLQLSLPAIAILFALYGFEKERALRRLTTAVIAEHLTKEQLSMQARQLRAALVAGKELSACLEPDDVIDTLLAGATDMFQASEGSVLLFEEGRLTLKATTGDDDGAHLDRDTVEAVAETRVPVRAARNAMVVPLVSEGAVQGVVVIGASARSAYGQHDLAVFAAFAEYAAQALVNAHRFKDERADTERLRALNAAQAEFSWLSHDLS